MLVKILILFLFSIQIWVLNCQEPCNTPLGLEGKCVDMDNCPPILAITKGTVRRNDSLFIKKSHCRNDRVNGKTILIMCCETEFYEPGCKEPPVPAGATVNSVSSGEKIKEKFPHGTIIKYNCENGRVSNPPNGIYCQENDRWSNQVACVDNVISIKRCPTLHSSTVSFIYSSSGKVNEPDHKITAKCSCLPNFVLPTGVELPNLVCINGQWDKQPIDCVPDSSKTKKLTSNTGPDQVCGSIGNDLNSEDLSTLYLRATLNDSLRNMAEESVYTSPWVAGIYMSRSKTQLFKCSGTIITPKIIVSAAHCFHLDRQGVILNATRFKVLVGSSSKTWPNNIRPGSLIQSKLVDSIKVPEKYRGFINNLEYDIAMVVLKTSLEWNNNVRPICYDLNLDTNSLELFGKVSSWSGTASLKSMIMPLIDGANCKNLVITGSHVYITDDKFCGGWDKDTPMCKQDDGAGVAVVKKNDGIERWYFQGFVAISFLNDPSCLHNKYKAFTNIYNHKDFIISILDQYDK